MKTYYFALCFILLLASCINEKKPYDQIATQDKDNVEQFTLLSSNQTGVDFINKLDENDIRVNTYDYVNAFNGGGVAIGDINNDGLLDLYFTANMSSNKLYLNKGDLKFEDISNTAKVTGEGGWSTGVTMVDINNDGFLDIYVSRAFNDENPALRENLLYINNKDLTFTEKAKEYGINDPNNTTQALFFDYDLDGHLDLFVGNHPREFMNSPINIRVNRRKTRPIEHSDRLYHNNGNGTFSDVTREAGILNHGFTLGVASSDLNGDNLPDLYVAVDHSEPDILYLNNGNGTFSDQIRERTKHFSNFGMGIDIADINNDSYPDIFEADMMAQDNFRQKTQMSGMNPERFWNLVKVGYHYQYMRNSLQLNDGSGNFSEIGQLSGVSFTDWSWATLLADFDNDGYKDLFVSNGYRKDVRNNDLNKKIKQVAASTVVDTREKLLAVGHALNKEMDADPLVNYYFKNNGDLTFTDVSNVSGINIPSYSNGAAYGDLDNDGDLDLVVSNLDHESFIYRNNAKGINKYNNIRVKLVGDEINTTGIGAKVSIKTDFGTQFQELNPTRGFQSSVEDFIHFGLKEATEVNELQVIWPSGKVSVLNDLGVNKVVTVLEKEGKIIEKPTKNSSKKNFESINPNSLSIDFIHKENEFNDYDREVLLPHKMSQFGPSLATSDVNGDGLDDFFVGGAIDQLGELYIQTSNNSFVKAENQPWSLHQQQEDIAALFFDADNDGDQDLYVVSGGNEFNNGSPAYQDRIYFNDGTGSFTYKKDNLPKMNVSGGCVVAGDYDKDGDLDLFIGGRQTPGKYPFPANSYVLQNNNGRFVDVTKEFAPQLVQPGMVTSAIWTDFDNDSLLDLIVVGEWMPIGIYKNTGTKLELIPEQKNLAKTNGWWNKIASGDFDKDGDQDYIIGNLGLNYKYKATKNEPFQVFAYDFDKSGTMDIVLGYYNSGSVYPLRGRQCSSEQIPSLTEKFPTYKDFASAEIDDVYGEDLEKALNYNAYQFASIYLENNADGFKIYSLPTEAQFSTVQDIVVCDYDKDGNLDAILAGNFYVSEVETGRADASNGLILKGDGKGNFIPIMKEQSGLNANLDARKLALINQDESPLLLVANNNDRMQFFKLEN